MEINTHACATCKRSNIKLYRYYGNFLRDAEIFCASCAPDGQIEKQLLVPLIEDEDGTVWGYTSVPEEAIERWRALPE